MYINEVLRTCDALCPNEYSDEEKYMWCDELSAMLMQEHLKKYDRVTLEAGEDGSYLLPEGVTFEMVDRIIDGAREIDKRDFRSYGIEYYYGLRGRFVFPVRNRVRSDIDVVYLKKHMPIRSWERECTIELFKNGTYDGFFATYKDIDGLSVGDTINIEIIGDNKEFNGVAVLDINDAKSSSLQNGGKCAVTVPDGTFDGILNGAQGKCRISRVVTDETVCDAPYDRMYVDFVNAQICYYQRDFDTYNQHMNLFNQRLNAYQAWLQQRRVQDRDGQMMNWW